MAVSLSKLGLVSLLVSSALAVPTHNHYRHRHLRRDVVWETDVVTQAVVVTDVVYATGPAQAPAVTPAPVVTPAPAPAAPAGGDVVNWSEVQDATPSTTPAPVAAPAPVPVEPAPSSAPAPASSSPVAAPSSAAPTPSTVPSPGSGSGGKRGVAYNQASLTDMFTTSAFSWAYNWACDASGSVASSLEYVPMLWSSRSDFTSSFDSNVKAALAAGSSHILGFNEPDLPAQANMSPSDAAAAWKQYLEPYSSQAKLVSPAVTNGAAPMGLAWLSEFMSACGDCSVDAVAIHWYDSATNIEYFKSYVQGAYEQFKKPLWISEFGASGSDDQVSSFLAEVLPWLDSQDYVERYAYFMADEGHLLSGSGLSTYGKTYVDTA